MERPDITLAFRVLLCFSELELTRLPASTLKALAMFVSNFVCTPVVVARLPRASSCEAQPRIAETLAAISLFQPRLGMLLMDSLERSGASGWAGGECVECVPPASVADSLIRRLGSSVLDHACPVDVVSAVVAESLLSQVSSTAAMGIAMRGLSASLEQKPRSAKYEIITRIGNIARVTTASQMSTISGELIFTITSSQM
mmetsp:Transcript_89135/g.167935  ORF Transcript_89135/g.167935 Transcript_89135/m.167935 type:complete len:200 (+) Transcript_89135:82-681(+)